METVKRRSWRSKGAKNRYGKILPDHTSLSLYQATYVSTVTMSVMQDEKGGSTFVNITYDDLVVEKPTVRFANKKRQRVGGKRIKKRVSFIDWRRTEDTHNNSLQNCVSSGSLIENQANQFQSMPRIDEY